MPHPLLPPSRRDLLLAAAALPLASIPALLRAAEPDLAALAPITGAAQPIGTAERAARLARAQALMKANDIGAVICEPGSSMVYFTGVRWSRSERPTLAILPAQGDPCIVTPFFEEPSVRQTLAIPASVRVWQEDESPYAVAAGFLRDRKLASRTVAVEETVRYFIQNGMARALPDARIVPADIVVRGVRMIKTAAEIALMQMATDVTIAAYRWTHGRVERGMTGAEIGALMTAAMRKLGGDPEFALALIGPAAALPHGSREVIRLARGDVLLMDSGCTVHDYQSDVSRTWVYGSASAQQRRVWDHVAEGQRIAFAAARIGVEAGSVDDAVRRRYAALGYGPDYRLPGLSHRTGHGIGMDGHEPVNLVRGERTLLAPGMCFSNEPGLYLPGKFGVRLEDCFHMTDTGPRWFSEPPRSIDTPV
ncbi:MAG TPA: Xaa-Pro peptidase family protein [Sphingomonas sp.]|nr:Xaa-Pro peptidase family protein [Sphingomonas sp.]